MLKIWEKFDPNGENDSDLENFIKDSHPAIRDMTARANWYVQKILRGIECLNKEKREQAVEVSVNRSWKMLNYQGEDFVKHFCDDLILDEFWGIYISNNGSTEIDGKEISWLKWSGKSRFDWNEKDLKEDWDFLWEHNQDDRHYGSDELKDWIWDKKGGKLEENLMELLKQAQAIIPDELRKDIDARVKIVNEKVSEYASAWIQFEKEREKGGKHEGKSFMKLDTSGEAPDIEKYHFADDYWKDLDHLGIVKKKEDERKAKAYQKDLGNAILDVYEYGTANLKFKDHVAAQVLGFKTLENMKKGDFLGGDKEENYGITKDEYTDGDGEIWFTPEWGECKDITDIKDFFKHIAKKRKIKKASFWCRWVPKTDWHVGDIEVDEGPEKKEETEKALLETRPAPDSRSSFDMFDKHSYFQLKDGEVEEIVEKELLTEGNLSGREDDLAHAYARTNGKKTWKDSEGKTWDQDSWQRESQPWAFQEEEN